MKLTKRFAVAVAVAVTVMVFAAQASAQSRLAGRGSLVKIDDNGKVLITPVSGQVTEVDASSNKYIFDTDGTFHPDTNSTGSLGTSSKRFSSLYTAANNTNSLTVGGGTAVTRIVHGTCTLTSGGCTVSNANVTTSSRIFLTGQDNNVAGALRVSARSAGVSFTVTSSSNTDSGVVAYEIIEP
jgi:hypothetical protein